MKSAEERLRGVGLRVTKPRLAVLAEVAAQPHVDIEAIATGARTRLGAVSTQAIYDVVHALTGVGLLRRVEPAGARAHFEIETGDNHHHLVCRGCGFSVEIEATFVESWAAQIASQHGFTDTGHELELFGLCRECGQRSK